MQSRSFGFAALISALMATAAVASPHRLLVQGNNRLAIVDTDGNIEWEMPWGGIHDVHVLKNGHIMVQQGRSTIAEIDPKTKQVVWTFDAAKRPGNQGTRIEVHAFQPLADDRIMVAESGSGKIIEIDRDGAVKHEIPLEIDRPDAHHDTRLARKLENGNYLVCHERDGIIREYDGQTGAVAWKYEVPLFGKERRQGHGPEGFGNQAFSALRLPNGNTLIATGNGHSVIEVTPQKEVVWKLDQHELPGITLAWVTTLEVLPDGHYVIGNCHAGPENPLLVEIEPKTKKVIWTFDQFNVFGNSVPNTQILGLRGDVLR